MTSQWGRRKIADMETAQSDVLVHYATKEDLQLVRVEMAGLRTDLQKLRGDMIQMGRDLERMIHGLAWKMIGLVVAGNAATITAVHYMLNS